jgi:hypothetical protein
MKTNELSGAALDWAVAKCAGAVGANDRLAWYTPSTDWQQGGAIIEHERLSITPREGYWEAYYHDNLFQDDGSDYFQVGTTPLIAAMRCYVASKMGDSVQLPEELNN